MADRKPNAQGLDSGLKWTPEFDDRIIVERKDNSVCITIKIPTGAMDNQHLSLLRDIIKHIENEPNTSFMWNISGITIMPTGTMHSICSLAETRDVYLYNPSTKVIEFKWFTLFTTDLGQNLHKVLSRHHVDLETLAKNSTPVRDWFNSNAGEVL